MFTMLNNLVANTDYLVFKQGIKPEWEDPKNNDGGKWVITLPIEENMLEECAYAWDQILLILIGANVEYELYEILNGAIFSIRDKYHRISVWVSDNTEQSLLKEIGTKIREISKLPMKFELGYQVHKKAIQHNLDNEIFIKA